MQKESLGELIDQYGTAVYRFCCKLEGNNSDADDLYQETFFTALVQAEKIDLNRNPKALLLRICIQLWRSNRRKFARRARLAPSATLSEAMDVQDGAESIEDQVMHIDLYQKVKQAADTLEEKYRVPIYLYYTLELSIDEVAAVLKLPSGTVKSRLHKARNQIKQRVEAEPYEEKLAGRCL